MKIHAKFLYYIILITITLALASSCADSSGNDEILTSKIQYDVPVNNNDPQLDWWINNIEGSKREPFLKRIMEAAGKGEVKAFDYFNNPLTPAQVQSIGTDTIYQTLMRTYPPYEEYDTMIVSSITYRDIVKVRFLEEWKWDPVTLEMKKTVMAIGPVTRKEIAGETFSQLLFWIALNERFPGK
jgi:hypothetical protein